MSDVKHLLVELGHRSYPIWIGQGLRKRLSSFLQELNIHVKQKILLITDSQVGSLYAEEIISQLAQHGYSVSVCTVPAGESSKSMSEYERIMTHAIEQKLDRQSLILALGGGVVGDLAGFVASTFMRGIPFIQMPTTILAHDSSVGGKVAINHHLGKNLIGSFYQPIAVIYDTETLSSLSRREVISGFSEVIKHGFIWDASFVEWLDKHSDECLSLQEPFLSEALSRACQIKTMVVAKDETEQHIRAILNFGHTFGHAFESLGGYSMFTHGEAISVGMVLAARLSDTLYGDQGMEDTVRRILDKYGLPISWSDFPWSEEEIINKMYLDKKVKAEALNLVLLKQIGQAELVENVNPELVKNTIVKGGE